MLSRLLLFGFLAITLITGSACVTGPNTNNVQRTGNTSDSGAITNCFTLAATQANVKITLPLLDALLTDKAFEREVKSRLKLTDDQVASLKRVSEAEINRLRESNAEETDGNGTDAPTRAAEELRSILGDRESNATRVVRERVLGQGRSER